MTINVKYCTAPKNIFKKVGDEGDNKPQNLELVDISLKIR